MKHLPLLLILALSPAPSAAAGHADRLHQLAAAIEAARRDMNIPAVAVTLVETGRPPWTRAFGSVDLAARQPVRDTTIFRIGSVTKMFTAMALLIAEQDGLLDLEDPARRFLPEPAFTNPWRDSQPVRIVHLLEHTAGLPDMSRDEFNQRYPMALRDAVAWKADARRVLWPPGLHHSYTNVGPGLAALVLEQAAGIPFERFVEERIFTPLGMHSASFRPDPEIRSRLATGYDSDGVTPIPYWHILYPAAGGINVRPAEMGAFIRLLLDRGEYRGRRVLSEAGIDRMEFPRTTLAARSGVRFGYGAGSYTWLHRGMLFHGHGGDADGYLSRLGYSYERGMGYFVVINVFRNRDLQRIRRLIEDFIAGDACPVEPAVHSLSRALRQRYAGHYQQVTRRFAGGPAGDTRETITIVDRDGTLRVNRAGRWDTLLPVNDRHFRYRREPRATAAFAEHAGRLYFQDDDGSYANSGPAGQGD